MHMTCKHYLERVLGWERSKLGFLGKKGLKPEISSLNWWAFGWASSKRASLVDSGHNSLERAPSELQASEPKMLLEGGRLSKQLFA